MKRIIICFFLIVWFECIHAVTLVYNLKVRRVFNMPEVLERMKNKSVFSAVPIFAARDSHIVNERTNVDTCENRKAGGSLFNIRYIPSKHWWGEITTGVIVDSATFNGTDTFHASRTGVDDIVFAGGYRHFIGKKWQFVGYGLMGLPTKRDLNLQDRFGPLVGTRLYNVGFGLEGSYSFINKPERSLAAVVQQRFIHGFTREWSPVLPQGSKLQPGNVTDLLFTLQYRERRTIVEGGYNATFYTNQATIYPTETRDVGSFIRHSVFASVSHIIRDGLWNKPLVLGLGCNINKTKQFDAKSMTAWLYGAIVF